MRPTRTFWSMAPMTVVSAQISAPNLRLLAMLPVLQEFALSVALQFEELSRMMRTLGLEVEPAPAVKMSTSSARAACVPPSAKAAPIKAVVRRFVNAVMRGSPSGLLAGRLRAGDFYGHPDALP